jgi:two-component system, sensor histidine kinase and response regulator
VYLFFNKIIHPIGLLEEKMKYKETIEDAFFLSQKDEIASIGYTYNRLLHDLQHEIKMKMDLLNQFKTFTANVIHQVRTPLSVMKIAQESISFNDAKLNVQASIVTMEHLFDTLAYSLYKNNMELPLNIMRLTDILLQRVSMFMPLAHANDMTIKTSIEVEYQININPIELEFLIDNNLSNAIKYGKPNHDIYVKVQKNSEDSVVEMSFYSFSNQILDTKLIFERFERLDKSKQGNGLGLHIVAEICDRYGIKINVDYVDNQNIFRYFIPC